MPDTKKGGVGKGIVSLAGRTLLHEAQNYAEARGEQLIRNLGQKAVGVLEGGALGGGDDNGGGPAGIGGAVKGALTGGVPGAVKGALGAGGGGRKGRRNRKSTNIIEDIDVPVGVSTAYNQWTQYPEFGGFMKGVDGVDKDEGDPTKSSWHLKVGPSRRSWAATTSEQVPDRRIVWSSQGAKGSTKGVVTFHPLADDLTKIIVVMEYTAVGPFEKVGNMMRLQLRRVRLDLREFKKFIAMRGEETDAWRGEIRDGEVVSEGDEGEGGPEESPEPDDHARSDEEEPAAESEEEEGPEEEEEERPAAREDREPASAGGRRRNS